MTRIIALKAFDMRDMFTASFGDPSPLGIRALALEFGGGIMRMWGSYDWNNTVGAVSGNFRHMTYVEGGAPVARINGFAANAVEFQELGSAEGGQAMLRSIMSGSDTLEGSGRTDRLYGFDGDDNMFGRGGNDRLFGGNGNDRIFGGAGDNRMYGGAGNDKIVGRADDDVLAGGSGDDSLVGGFGDDTFIGGAGNDFMTGSRGADVFIFRAGSGRDSLFQIDSTDTIALDRALLDGMSVAEFVRENARAYEFNTVLDLSDDDRIVFRGITDVEDVVELTTTIDLL